MLPEELTLPAQESGQIYISSLSVRRSWLLLNRDMLSFSSCRRSLDLLLALLLKGLIKETISSQQLFNILLAFSCLQQLKFDLPQFPPSRSKPS